MTDITRRHPRTLCSLVIIRDPHEFRPRSAIRSTALSTVTRSSEAVARFEIDHRAYDQDADRADILNDLAASIPSGATLIARASLTPQHYLRRAFAAGGPLPAFDLQLIQRERLDLNILPLQCPNRALEEVAAAYQMKRAGPGSNLLSRSRRAPDEAQCLWAVYLWSQCSPHERTALGTAWEAWRAIERARPLPF